MPQWTIRLPDDLAQQIQKAAQHHGFSSPRAFIREAIRNELQDRTGTAEEVEERIAASLDGLARELRRLETAQQAQFALTDALAKVVLVCLPEPPNDVLDQARTRARLRYDKFLKSVASGMTGHAHSALTELVRDAD